MKGLTDKRILVTGGATGIGRAAAVRMAEEGAHVAVNHIGAAGEAEALVARLKAINGTGRFVALEADISDEDAVERLFDDAAKALGGIDVLVNNAGIKALGLPHEVEMDDYDRVMGINMRGAFLCARAAIRHFLDADRKGVIVTTTSIHQVVPMPEASVYMMSKAGLYGLTTTLALAYADRGIRVVGVGPGAIMTPMNADLAASPDAAARVEKMVPMGRIAAPEEIASVIAFLASDDASYITGQTIYADGGMMLARPGKQ